MISVLTQIATNCGIIAERLERKFSSHPELYYRLSVDAGLGDITLAEWKEMGLVRAHTQNYLRLNAVSNKIDGIVRALIQDSTSSSPAVEYTTAEIGNVTA